MAIKIDVVGTHTNNRVICYDKTVDFSRVGGSDEDTGNWWSWFYRNGCGK